MVEDTVVWLKWLYLNFEIENSLLRCHHITNASKTMDDGETFTREWKSVPKRTPSKVAKKLMILKLRSPKTAKESGGRKAAPPPQVSEQKVRREAAVDAEISSTYYCEVEKKMKLLTFRYFQNFLSVFQDIWVWKQAISVVLFGPLFRSQILLKHDILLNFVILGVFNHLNFGLLTSKINPDTLNIIEYT